MRSHEKLTHVGVLDHMILAQNNLECDRQRCVPAADATDLGGILCISAGSLIEAHYHAGSPKRFRSQLERPLETVVVINPT